MPLASPFQYRKRYGPVATAAMRHLDEVKEFQYRKRYGPVATTSLELEMVYDRFQYRKRYGPVATACTPSLVNHTRFNTASGMGQLQQRIRGAARIQAGNRTFGKPRR